MHNEALSGRTIGTIPNVYHKRIVTRTVQVSKSFERIRFSQELIGKALQREREREREREKREKCQQLPITGIKNGGGRNLCSYLVANVLKSPEK